MVGLLGRFGGDGRPVMVGLRSPLATVGGP